MVRINTNKLAKYCLIAFWTLVTLTKLFQIAFFFYPAIILGALGIILGDDTYRISFCLMLVPNIRMFDGLRITYIVNVLLALPLFAKILTDRKINSTALAHTLALISLELAHILYMQNYHYLLPNMAAIIMLYYVETVMLDRNADIRFNEIVRKFAFGTCYSAITYFIIHSRVTDMSIYLNGSRFSGYASDPNYFSLYICLAVTLIFVIKTHKVCDYIFLPILIATLLVTVSKMALLTLLVILLFFAARTVYYGFSYKTRFIKRFLMAGIALALVFIRQITNLISNTFNRFREHQGTAVDINTITSNRITLISFYSYELITNPLLLIFGYGMQYNEIYNENLSHNTFVDIILSWGLLGLFLFVSIFFTIIRRLLMYCPDKLTADYFFPLIVMCLMFLSLSCLSASMFWWIVCAALLPLKGCYNNEPAYIDSSTGLQRRKIHLRMHRVSG